MFRLDGDEQDMPGSYPVNEGPKGSHLPKIQVDTLGKKQETQ